MTPARIAIIGAGGISRAHLGALAALAGRATLAAVVDANVEAVRRTLAEHPGARGFESIDAFFDADPRSFADAVILCTPPSVRVEPIERALAIGLPILVEKPVASTIADAGRIARLAKSHPDAVAWVGFCHRFAPAVVEMRRRIEAGELGDVVRFENTFAGWLPRLRDHWMSDPAVSGGGALLDTGCHSLDLFRHLIGEASVTAAVFHHGWPGRGETAATVMLRGTSLARHPRCVGIIESGWAEPGRFTLRIVGERAALAYDYDRPTELHVAPRDEEPGIVAVESHESRFVHQMNELLDQIGRQGDTGVAATLIDGVAVSKLVDEAGKVRQLI